jgi:hypothetical protein
MISSRPDELINRRLFGPNKRPIRPDDPLETTQADHRATRRPIGRLICPDDQFETTQADHPGETRRHRPFPVRRLRS